MKTADISISPYRTYRISTQTKRVALFTLVVAILRPDAGYTACGPGHLSVAATAKHFEKKVLAVAKVDPSCNMVELGFLAGTEPGTLIPIGQPGNSTSGWMQQEMNAPDPGTYWIAAYARDEEGNLIQSPPFPVHLADIPVPAELATAQATAEVSTYTGTDADFLQITSNNHLASTKRFFREGSDEFTFGSLKIDFGQKNVSNTSRDAVLSESLQPIPTRTTTVNFDAAQVQAALDSQDLISFSNFPRTGLYQVFCNYSVFPFTSSNCSDSFGSNFLHDIAITTVTTNTAGTTQTNQVDRSSVSYFVPSLPSGKRVKEAKLSTAFTATGEQPESIVASMLLNGIAPSSAQIFSCTPGVSGFSQLLNCQGSATWDLTPEATSLATSGGGVLSIAPQMALQFSGTSTTSGQALSVVYKSMIVSPLTIDYPWGTGSGGTLRILFEDICANSMQINLTPDTVSPRGPGLPANQSTVEVGVNSCPPSASGPSLVVVDLEVDPNQPTEGSADSGGHEHGGKRPKGKFDPGGSQETDCTAAIDAAGRGSCFVTYFPPEVGGRETIIAQATNFAHAEKKITVEVPGLANLASISINFLRLTGQLFNGQPLHTDNHWGSAYTLSAIQLVGLDFFADFGATLGLNDLSLRQGGLFDIAGTWTTPHDSHRKGTSVDIDGIACVDPNLAGGCSRGTIAVNKIYIGQRCGVRGNGWLAKESQIHCEFPN